MKTFCKLYKYGYLILAMAACLMLVKNRWITIIRM